MFTYQASSVPTQSTSNTTIAVSQIATAINANDLLVAVLTTNDANTTVTDDSSNVWTVLPVVNRVAIAYCLSAVQATQVTVTQSGSSSIKRFLTVDQFSPTGRAGLLSVTSASITTSSASGTCGTINGDSGGNLLYGGVASDTASATFTAGSSNAANATIGAQVGNAGGSGFSEYIVSTNPGVQAMSWTVSPNISSRAGYSVTFEDIFASNLSPGGNRAFTFADVIKNLQQDVENATQTDSIDQAFTLLSAVSETAMITEGLVTAATSSTAATWGTMVWGEFVWG